MVIEPRAVEPDAPPEDRTSAPVVDRPSEPRAGRTHHPDCQPNCPGCILVPGEGYADQLHLLIAALEAAANAIIITDAQGHVAWANAAFTLLTGYTLEEVRGQTPRVLKSGQHDDAFYAHLWDTIRSARVWHGEMINRRKDGSVYHEEMTITPVRTAAGEITHFVAVKQDVSGRRAAEKRLHDSEALYRLLADHLPLGVYQKHPNGRYTLVNREFCRLTGWTPEEILGRTDEDLFPPELAMMYREEDQHVLETGETFTSTEDFVTRDGRALVVETIRVPAFAQAGQITALQGLIRDVTERKEADAKLQRERILLRTVIDNIPDAIYAKDTECRKTLANRADQANLGCRHEAEVLGKTDLDLLPRQEAVTLMIVDQNVIQTGQPVLKLEESFFNKEGRQITVLTSKIPLRNEAGQIVGLVGIGRDISQAKRAEEERQRMEVQLRHAQKMESIGRLAAGIAHEINTPVQYIGDNARFLQDAFADLGRLVTAQRQLQLSLPATDPPSPELEAAQAAWDTADAEYLLAEVPRAILQSLDGVERVTRIVQAMKEFSHPGGGQKTPTDLNRAIQSTVTVARNEWKYVSDLALDLDPDLPLVTCQRGEINQVVLNLVINAAHAIAEKVGTAGDRKGEIRVSTRRDGDWADILVRDTGCGIPADIRGRVFDPFFTTKGVGKGTGQGLAIAHAVVVEKHGGIIDFETVPGEGTTFRVRLPLNGGGGPGPGATA